MPLDNAFHYLYRITVEGEKYAGFYYYGKHSTNNLGDGYLGSGIRVKRLKAKGYTLRKEILCFFNSAEEALEAEELLVDEELLSDPFCLNLKTGGGESCTYSEESRRKMSEGAKERGAVSNLQRKAVREKAKAAQSETRKKLWKDEDYLTKMSRRAKGRGRSKECVTPLGVFPSASEAAKAHEVSRRTLTSWLLKPNKIDFTYTQE